MSCISCQGSLDILQQWWRWRCTAMRNMRGNGRRTAACVVSAGTHASGASTILVINSQHTLHHALFHNNNIAPALVNLLFVVCMISTLTCAVGGGTEQLQGQAGWRQRCVWPAHPPLPAGQPSPHQRGHAARQRTGSKDRGRREGSAGGHPCTAVRAGGEPR